MLVFSHIMKNLLSIVFPCCTMSPVWWGFHDTLVPLDSPGPQKKFIRLLPYFTCCWEDSFGVKSLQDVHGALKHIYIKCLWVLLTHVYWFRATGGYICGCGRPSNRVSNGICGYFFLGSHTRKVKDIKRNLRYPRGTFRDLIASNNVMSNV